MRFNQTKLIARVLVGSRLYQTNKEDSDFDFIELYMDSPHHIIGTGIRPRAKHRISGVNDITRYSFSHFITLLLKGSPNAHDALFAPERCIKYKTNEYDKLLDVKQHFLSGKLLRSLFGHSVQAHKDYQASGNLKKAAISIIRLSQIDRIIESPIGYSSGSLGFGRALFCSDIMNGAINEEPYLELRRELVELHGEPEAEEVDIELVEELKVMTVFNWLHSALT